MISSVGQFYKKHPHEEALGPVFVRRTLDNYHVCKKSRHRGLYEIVADVRDPELADQIADILRKRIEPSSLSA